jgi:3-dehydroquinate synthase
MLAVGEGTSLGAPGEVSLSNALEKFDYDKKHKAHVYRMVMPQKDGQLELISVARDDAERKKIRAAFASSFEALGWNYH